MEKQDIILHVDHMTKCFGDLKVLNDISFDVHRGEFLCIVGPTGCGKTTFLNCITGLYDLTGGQILVNGELVDTKSTILPIFSGIFNDVLADSRRKCSFRVENEKDAKRCY